MLEGGTHRSRIVRRLRAARRRRAPARRSQAGIDRIVTVGFQGEPGAFSEEAALAYFGTATATRGYYDFDALVAAVAAGNVEYGLLPCENSIFGSIARAYDLLLGEDRASIVGETRYEIVQCLIGVPGAAIESIERVRSHPVALDQCRTFLRERAFAHVEPVHDTAGAIREVVAAGDPRVGAIGPESAAGRYGGVVLDRAIADEELNVTRFFVIARDAIPRERPTKLCLAFVLPHEPGSLHRALGTLAEHGVNLRSLVARPRPKHPFEYVFYAELDARESLDPSALATGISPQTRLLGRY